MKPLKLMFVVVCLIVVSLSSGCGGGNGKRGGNGGNTADYCLNVTIDPEGAGVVSLTPDGGTYPKNTEVTLRPVAGEGYEFSGWDGPNKNEVMVKGDRRVIVMNGHKQLVASFTELKPNQVAAPTASPLGGKVVVGTEITLTTTTDGATIYYTVNGSEPTTGSMVYSDTQKPVVTEGGVILKALAVKEGMLASNIATFVYSTYPVQSTEPIAHVVNGVEFRMRQAPAGLIFPFGMFDTETTIDYAYWIGDTEVTYKLWSEVYNWATAEARGNARYFFENNGHPGSYYDPDPDLTQPVTTISWRDAIVWCS